MPQPHLSRATSRGTGPDFTIASPTANITTQAKRLTTSRRPLTNGIGYRMLLAQVPALTKGCVK